MSGERYIKQAVIAALCEHPDQDKYHKLAFSGANLPKVMEALSSKGQELTKADFFTPDDDGKLIIDTPGFWKNFEKITAIFAKNGDILTVEDLTKPLSRRDDTTLVERAIGEKALDKLFSFEIWKGRFDDMEKLWFRIPGSARKDAVGGDGLIRLELKRKLLAFEGKPMPEDGLAAAGLSLKDMFNVFAARGNFEEMTRKLADKGDKLRKEYILLRDTDGDTIFFYPESWAKYKDITRKLKENGQNLEVEDFIRKVGVKPNILQRAFEKKALAQVFDSTEWVGRLPDMKKLWDCMLEGWKSGAMTPKDFDDSFAEAEKRTFADQIDFSKVTTRQELLTPLNGGNYSALPVGLKSFWENIDSVMTALSVTGDKILISDLRQPTGETQDSSLMKGVKQGAFEKIISISKVSGEALTLGDFLSKDHHGETLLNILSERRELAQAFSPEIWAGRVDDMKALWKHVKHSAHIQVDISKAEIAAKQATLKLLAKNTRFKPSGPK